ncbi:MAG: SDR family NAD(P)-dependent oxidoreductase [Deltaproteobacteria bacterium]|nr:SDR family NAD(P)-dependent oxidoreductase [Deltaproteobacteria bacterium]
MDPTNTTISASDDDGAIAIIGMACRFPGARNLDEYWANLVAGKESIRTLSGDELIKAGVPRRFLDDPTYVKACPVLDDIDKFDAAFFGISPRDAAVMDPAHRFFLEVAWQALENAGNTGLADESTVGVFASSGAPLYWMNNVRSHHQLVEAMGEFLVRHTGNDMNFLATRASYDLDLRGPSLNVQTACSSALAAAHLARQSLLARECDMALIGGSTILVPMAHGYHWKEGEILSPDGHCRPFDHRSAGTVFGSGTGCLVLKRLTDALDNGDTIYAVIKGSAINNDGSVKVGFLAPGVEGQADVIKKALASANVSARSISYVEAHGTGTSVGDPIELTALEQAFAEQTTDKQFCGIGSVKSNIGHLGEAAAAAALIKLALSLKHRTLPPSLGFEAPNPRFDMANSPFYVNASCRPWQSSEPLRAGITALGAGGTNVHLVLEEPPAFLEGEGGRTRNLLVLSAKSKPALERMSANLAAHIESHASDHLADVAFTLAMGRRSLCYRRVLVARDRADAVALLKGLHPTRLATLAADQSDPSVVYTFPGGGAQYARMCLDLYEAEPAFRSALDDCFAIIDAEIDPNIRSLLFAPAAQVDVATKALQRPAASLPTLFSVEYALARLFDAFGLRPAAYVGHSMGEYVAACLAGVFSLRDGLRLVALRGRLFETTQKGKMVGVSLSEAQTRAIMPAGLSIAAVNAPTLCVASGPSELIDELTRTLTAQQVDWTPIHIDVAAHSSLLEPILDEFRRFCRTISFRAPQKPVASNLTGRWLTPAEATDPEYWVRHLRGTVRFSDCVETVLADGNRVFLEIGPGRTLTTLVAAQATSVRHAFNSVRHPKEEANDVDYALQTLGKVWAAGAKVDWTALYDGQLRNRIPLPVYPFEGQSYWVDGQAVHTTSSTELVKRENIDEWFYAATWQPAPILHAHPTQAAHWLIFANDAVASQLLAEQLQQHGASDVVIVSPGAAFNQRDLARFELVEGNTEHYRQLLEQLKSEGRAPQHIVMLLDGHNAAALVPVPRTVRDRLFPKRLQANAAPSVEQQLTRQFFAPVHLAQAIAGTLEACALTLVTHSAFALPGTAPNPWARLTAGPAQVIPRELPELATRLIDLDAAFSATTAAERLAHELLNGDATSPLLLRGNTRLTQQLCATRLPPPNLSWLSDGDLVLITGGLGGLGLAIAQHLVGLRKGLKLVLLSREGLPPSSRWQAQLASAHTSAQTKRRLAAVSALQAHGAQVMAVAADVTDAASLRIALAQVRAQLGPLHVVIHAAGIMDDEPLQTKPDEKMRRVLDAKVKGTVNLDDLIHEPLKAFVLMSSVASFLGLPGQVDYTAANAFQDAFAAQRQAHKPGRSLSINWNAWREVGMVVNVEQHTPLSALPTGTTNHPWLQASEETPQGRRYFTDFSTHTHWLLREHHIKGAQSLIPGTGFIELARAAFTDAASHHMPAAPANAAIEFRQVTFLHPFQVAGDQTRRLQIDVQWENDVASVELRTTGTNETHMTAEIRLVSAKPQTHDLAKIRAACVHAGPTRDGFLDQDFVQFGPRWQNIAELHFGTTDALINLQLPQPFSSDLPTFAFHPALADMATGAAQKLIPGFRPHEDFYVPFGYDRITLLAPLEPQMISHVTLRPETTGDVAAFDVHICTPAGTPLVTIQGFTMKRVHAQATITQSAPTSEAAKPTAAMAAILREAITPAEGVVAFERALSQSALANVVISSVDVNLWLRKLAADSQRLKGDDAADATPSFSRPDLNSEYVAPAGALQTSLAAIWSRLLGVGNVGAMDDFFELGGNSLTAVRLFARIKKDFGISLPLSTLFAAPSITLLAEVLRSHGFVAEAESQGATPPAPTIEVQTMPAPPHIAPPLLIRPGKTPLFFVHDGLGEVLLYRNLAMLISPEYAVYGLAPETAGGQFIHTRITDMAAAKVQRVRSVQPHGPYLLAGLCAGGIIAFEMARQLEDAGEETHFVGIIDAADVHAEERKLRSTRARLNRALHTLRRPTDQTLLTHVSGTTTTMLRKTLNVMNYEVSKRLERIANQKRVDQLQTHAAQGVAEPVIEFLKLYELAHKQHTPQGVFRSGNVVLFRATQGTGDVADVPFREVYSDPLLGWSPRVQGPVTVVDIPGGHSSALQMPHVEQLAKVFQDQLDRAVLQHMTLAPFTPTTSLGFLQ